MTKRIFSTGVYLVPCEVEIDGKKQWRWLSDGFGDDSFDENGDCIDVYDYADTVEGLQKPTAISRH